MMKTPMKLSRRGGLASTLRTGVIPEEMNHRSSWDCVVHFMNIVKASLVCQDNGKIFIYDFAKIYVRSLLRSHLDLGNIIVRSR